MLRPALFFTGLPTEARRAKEGSKPHQTMKLSPHFILAEMIESQTATRLQLKNRPNKTQIAALAKLCQNTLEPLRNKLGKPVKISSGFRSPLVNRAVGGSVNSQHMRGEAADIQVFDMSTQQLFDFILANGIVFDQIIQEFDSWVHISFKSNGKQRRNILYARHDRNGKVVFSKTKPGSVMVNS